MKEIRITRSNMAGMDQRRKYQFRKLTNTFAYAQPEISKVVRITFFHRHCVRAVKEMDSKSIGLCPQAFESPRCRFSLLGTLHASLSHGGNGSPVIEHTCSPTEFSAIGLCFDKCSLSPRKDYSHRPVKVVFSTSKPRSIEYLNKLGRSSHKETC